MSGKHLPVRRSDFTKNAGIAVPHVLPGEFALGYLGALGWRNSPARVQSGSFSDFARFDVRFEGLSEFEIFSHCADLTTKHAAARHTLDGFEGHPSFGRNNGEGDELRALRALRPDMYFCKKCVEGDLMQFGRSYWHRDHQVPGVYACLIHPGAVLLASSGRNYSAPPSTVSGRSEPQWKIWCANVVVVRYAELVSRVMNGALLLDDCDACATVFRHQIDRARLPWLGSGFALELVEQFVPADWIVHMTRERRGTYFDLRTAFSEALRRGFKPVRNMCRLVMAAVIFQSVDEAMVALANPHAWLESQWDDDPMVVATGPRP